MRGRGTAAVAGLLLAGCVVPIVRTTRALPLEVSGETRRLVVAVATESDDRYHLIVVARPTVVTERDLAWPTETTETQGHDVRTSVTRETRHDVQTARWTGTVRVEAGGQLLTSAPVDDGVARLDVRLAERWLRTVDVVVGDQTFPVDLTRTAYGAAWLGDHVRAALADGRSTEAQAWMNEGADTPAEGPLTQAWCEAALGPARLAAARDDLGHFVLLVGAASAEGTCRTLRDQAGEVASVQAGLALASGDRDLATRWAAALRDAGEADRAGRIEAGLGSGG